MRGESRSLPAALLGVDPARMSVRQMSRYPRAEYIFSDCLWERLGDGIPDLPDEQPLSEHEDTGWGPDAAELRYEPTSDEPFPVDDSGIEDDCRCDACEHPLVIALNTYCEACRLRYTFVHDGCPRCSCSICGSVHHENAPETCGLDQYVGGRA